MQHAPQQHGEWSLTLEGVCRVHIGSLVRHQDQEFHCVDVAAADSLGTRSHEAAWDKQVDLLHKQVARAGGHLFTSLQAATGVLTIHACDVVYAPADSQACPPRPTRGACLPTWHLPRLLTCFSTCWQPPGTIGVTPPFPSLPVRLTHAALFHTQGPRAAGSRPTGPPQVCPGARPWFARGAGTGHC